MQVFWQMVRLAHLCSLTRRSGGCQFQPVPYDLQLAHKKRTVELAYKRFSHLEDAMVPAVRDTIPSPKQWAYRTKITPHFDQVPRRIKELVGKQTYGVSKKYETEEDLLRIVQEHDVLDEEPADEEERQNEPRAPRQPWRFNIGFQETNGNHTMDIEASSSLSWDRAWLISRRNAQLPRRRSIAN